MERLNSKGVSSEDKADDTKELRETSKLSSLIK